jgi:hypothetical protein
LEAEHGIDLSYTWVKQALQGAGLVGRGRKRGAHRKRRERRCGSPKRCTRYITTTSFYLA